jgi:hypothetical protein
MPFGSCVFIVRVLSHNLPTVMVVLNATFKILPLKQICNFTYRVSGVGECNPFLINVVFWDVALC